jgi:hypothetical protein
MWGWPRKLSALANLLRQVEILIDEFSHKFLPRKLGPAVEALQLAKKGRGKWTTVVARWRASKNGLGVLHEVLEQPQRTGGGGDRLLRPFAKP